MSRERLSYRGYRFPFEIFSHAGWLYQEFGLSFQNVQDLLAERGVNASYESVWHWCRKISSCYAADLKRGQGQSGDTWYLREFFLTICGRRQYLWGAADQDGDVIDILIQPRCDQQVAERFFCRLLKRPGSDPRRLVTDKLWSYSAAHRPNRPTVIHDTRRCAKNRAEVSHEPTRQRKRQMRRLKSPAQAQQFLTIHGFVGNLFWIGRHLISACNYRFFRSQAFAQWRQATCAR